MEIDISQTLSSLRIKVNKYGKKFNFYILKYFFKLYKHNKIILVVGLYTECLRAFRRLKRRSYEKCLKKINNNFWSIEFNLICYKNMTLRG